MLNQKPLFETHLGKQQYLQTFLRSLITIIPTLAIAVRIPHTNNLFYLVIFTGLFLTVFLVLRTLKTFHLNSNAFVIKRFVFKDEVFPISEIIKIEFYSFSFGRNGKIPVMRIVSKHKENEFGLIYVKAELKHIVRNLQKSNINVVNLID